MDGFFFSVDSIFVGFFRTEFFTVLPQRNLCQDYKANEQVGLFSRHVLPAYDHVFNDEVSGYWQPANNRKPGRWGGVVRHMG